MSSAGARDYASAASMLDLSSIPASTRAERGPLLAAQLSRVLEESVILDTEHWSDDADGDPADGVDVEQIGMVPTAAGAVPILLSRDRTEKKWSISSSTVSRIPALYAPRAPGLLESRMPEIFLGRAWGIAAWQWLGLLLSVIAASLLGRLGAFFATRFFGRLASRTEATWDDELVVALRRPARFGIALIAFSELKDLLALPASASAILGTLFAIIGIGTGGWTLVLVVDVVSRVVERQAVLAGEGVDSLHARTLRTQVSVLRRVLNVAICILAAAFMLTQFEVVRSVGMSLLASAGVAGIVLGFAAQRTIGSLIAGIQLSFTQPIRIGDVVVVENAWGTIEEITLTYVVVKVWDERRLIVPMTRFLEQPFENWTKRSAELHGTVFFQADFRLPIDDVRRELDRIVIDNPRWDGRTKSVCVTNATDRTMEVRALVSAANADDLWNLRVEVRERILEWLRKRDDGRYLPVLRVDDRAPQSMGA